MSSLFTNRLRTRTLLLAAALLLAITLFARSMTANELFFLHRHACVARIRIADGLFSIELSRNLHSCSESFYFHSAIPTNPRTTAAELATRTLYESYFILDSQSLDCELLTCRLLLSRPADAALQFPLWLPPALLTLHLLRRLRRLPKPTPPSFEILPTPSPTS